MPGALQMERDADEYAWLLSQADALKRRRGVDHDGIRDFLEEAAEDMLSRVTSQIVNLLAHTAKAAHTKNSQVIGHWRSECAEFHDQIVDAYRPSMRQKIDMQALWKRAQRKVYASFEDHGEPRPNLPKHVTVAVETIVDPDLHFEMMIGWMKNREIDEDRSEEDYDELVDKVLRERRKSQK